MKVFGRILMALGLVLVAGSLPVKDAVKDLTLISGQEAKASTRWWTNCS